MSVEKTRELRDRPPVHVVENQAQSRRDRRGDIDDGYGSGCFAGRKSRSASDEEAVWPMVPGSGVRIRAPDFADLW